MQVKIFSLDNEYCFYLNLDDFNNDDFYKDIIDIYKKSDSYEDFIVNFSKKFNRNIVKQHDTKFFVHIHIFETYMIYMLYNSIFKLIDAQKYFSNKFNKGIGNCVDTFLNKAINKNMFTIESFVHDINCRQKERTNCLDYHNTTTFESDFSQIVKISKILKKMLRNCDKQLEMMSEKYTSL